MVAASPVTKLLVSSASGNPAVLMARRAATMAGRTSPDSRARISRASTVWPASAASPSKRSAKPSRSTSLRSRAAQALESGLVAFNRRMSPSGSSLARS